MKLEFSRQNFKKQSNIKFHGNMSTGKRVVPCRQTDTLDEANSRCSQFCELAYMCLMFGMSVEVSLLLTEEQS
jgi:hypothetical protein